MRPIVVLGLAAGVAGPGCDTVFGVAPPELTCPTSATIWDDGQLTTDEDGDRVPDGCDVCPGASDVTQADDDGDGVGDACDPHRGDPRDHLHRFDGFTSTDPLWVTLVGGDWSFDGSAVRQTDLGALRAALVLDVDTPRATIEVVIGDVSDGLGAVGAGADLEAFQGQVRGILCTVVRTANNVGLVASNPPHDANGETTGFSTGERVRLRASVTGACVGSVDDGASVSVMVTSPDTTASGRVGIYTASATAAFHAVTVIVTDP